MQKLICGSLSHFWSQEITFMKFKLSIPEGYPYHLCHFNFWPKCYDFIPNMHVKQCILLYMNISHTHIYCIYI